MLFGTLAHTCTMYCMKKIITHDAVVELPKCMYKLKNLYSFEETFCARGCDDIDLNINEQVIQFLKKSPNVKMTELEQRQDKLLKKLDVLYNRIVNLSSSCIVQSNQEISKNNENIVTIPEEIVLAASPDNFPWFIYLLVKQATLQVNISCHIHSSVPNEKVAKIKGFINSIKTPAASKINLRLIFKGGIQDSELRLSSLAVPIVGNVNILRYLAFVYPSIIKYDHDDFHVDSLLDICHMLERVPEKNKEALVKKLFVHHKSWIYNNDFSIVDVAAFNVVRQWKNAAKYVSKEWLDKCEKLAS